MTGDLTLGALVQAEELWQHSLRKILENIEDPNTAATDVRELVLKFKFTADADRRVGSLAVSCATKLAGIRATSTPVYYGKRHGRLAIVTGPTQDSMFPDITGTRLEIVRPQEPTA